MAMEDVINRSEYVKEYKEMAKDVITKEQLPMISDVINFAVDGDISPRLQHVFDFFGDEEELRDLTSRKTTKFTSDDSSEFIDKVIAANVDQITQAGSTYKKLQATGDSYRIRGTDCNSDGREVSLYKPEEIEDEEGNVTVNPDNMVLIDEKDFTYEIKNCNTTYEKDSRDYKIYHSYEEFVEDVNARGLTSLWVRSPITCKYHTKHGCCPVCAGEIPEGSQNIGSFATLMITEVATQAALSSMNKGKKENVNGLLARSSAEVKTLEDYYKWVNEILNELKGDSVERRWYEIALLGRLHVYRDGTMRVSALQNPGTSNYLGEFIYRPRKASFRDMISHGEFFDSSLKAQIALNSYDKGYL